MQLYSGSTEAFQQDISDGVLPRLLEDAYSKQILSKPSPSEVKSWENSLAALSEDIEGSGIAGGGILVEHMLPLSSKRIDALLFGRDSQRAPKPLLVELKQWTSADIEETDDTLVTVAGRLALHPQLQVAQYVQYLRDFHPSIYDGEVDLAGLAYLHNASDSELEPLRQHEIQDVDEFPMVSRDQREELQEQMHARLEGGEGEQLLEDFVNEPFRPSKKLLEHVAAEIEGNEAFTLLDDQLVAYEITRKAVERARAGEGKSVVIVTGGPGSGKSVIATRMIGDFAGRGWNVGHATGSRAFTLTLRKQVGRRTGQVFRYFNQFGDADLDSFDALICDEAHRIRKTSNSRFTPKDKRSDLPQVDELIQVAKVPVFLLDEHQGVKPDEIGRVSVIREAAERNDAEVTEVHLDGQFRCGGSTAYTEWVLRLLELEDGGPVAWTGEDEFEVAWADSPATLESWLLDRQEDGVTGRIAAGFCWPWSDPNKDGTLVQDVVIDGWSRPWNAKPNKRRIKDAPPAEYWATDPRGFGQVGCIYTAQGFEYDYGGVIFGPDMKWRDGAWAPDRDESADPLVRRAQDFDMLVRHVYKVLLTRGLRGCAVHATDAETSRLLRSLVPSKA